MSKGNKKLLAKIINTVKAPNIAKNVPKTKQEKIVEVKPTPIVEQKLGKRDIIFRETPCAYLGGGIDGSVYRFGKYALKRYEDSGDHAIADYETEVRMLEILKHDNIVRMFDSFVDDWRYVVLELGTESVRKYLNKLGENDLIKLRFAKKIIRDVLRGLAHIHDAGIIHRDLKVENFIMTGAPMTHHIKIIDFASACYVQDASPRTIGTLVINSPEALVRAPLSYGSDIWSFALSAFEILTTQLIFDANDEHDYDYCDELSYVSYGNSSDYSSEYSGSYSSSAKTSETQSETLSETLSETPSISKEECSHIKNADDSTYRIIYRLLLLQEKILGSPPESLTYWAPFYYNSNGRLKNTQSITYINLENFIKLNFPNKFNNHITPTLLDFVLQCLKWESSERPSAAQLLNHAFLA